MSDNIKAGLLTFIFIVGCFFILSPSKSLFKHKPQHHEGENFENWSNANEFEASKLIGFGKILKVGKDSYLLLYTSCGLIKYNGGFQDVTSADTFDSFYKTVSLEQLTADVNKECSK